MYSKLTQILELYVNDKNVLITNFSYHERLNLLLDILNKQSKYENEKWFNKLNEIYNKGGIIFFTLEESLNFFINDLNEETKPLIEIFLGYLDDKARVRVLETNSIYITDFIAELISGIKDESLKLEYFKKNKEFFKYDYYIISKMSDESLIKILEICREEKFNFNYNSFIELEKSIIDRIKDKTLKLKIILNLENYSEYIDEIKILIKEKQDDNITSFVIDKLLDTDLGLAFSLIELIKNEQNRLRKLLKLITNFPKAWNYTKVVNILNSINDIKLKKQHILEIIEELGLTKYPLTSLIMLLEEDDLKLYLLEIYKDKVFVSDIIISIKNEELRKHVFKLYLSDDEFLKKVIKSFDNDKIKLELLQEYYPVMLQNTKIEIIVSLKEDKNKLNLLEKIKFSMEQRWRILLSLKDDELKLNLLILEAKQTMNFGLLNEFIQHDDTIFKLKEVNLDLLEMYSDRYNLNYNNLKSLTYKFGYIILRYIDNKNILNIINSDEDSLNKFLSLFDKENSINLDKTNIDSIYVSLIQRIFRNKNIDNIFNLFNNLIELIEANQKEKLIQKLLQIKKEGIIDFDIGVLVNDLFDINKRQSATNKLNELIIDYIIIKRNLYSEERKLRINKDLNLEFKYEKRYLINVLIRTAFYERIIDMFKQLDKSLMSDKAKELLNDEETLLYCIDYKRNSSQYIENLNMINQNLKYTNELLNLLYIQSYNELEKIIFDEDNSKREMSIKTTDQTELLKIISSIDINLLKDNLFNNEFLYNELLKVLKKHKFLGWDNIFDKLLNEADIEFDSDSKANIINYFYKYYPILLDKVKDNELESISLTSIIDLVSIYSSVSTVYKVLLGKEDFELICANQNPNAATIDKSYRLKQVPLKIIELYKRKYITVPPFERSFDVNDKRLLVTIGNTSDTINLTYGERTGACMRIGGVGESLFNFCLKNENGFHVMITEPRTNTLISRVSGFRNGNTIFLNQLRYSLNNSYTDKDLKELIGKVSRYIIDITKSNEYPVENVIISNGYAMESEKDKTIILDKDIKEGFEHFYSDVSSSNAILLATSKEDGSIAEIKLGKENAPRYPVLRQKVKVVTEQSEITRLKTRMHIISNLLQGKEILDCITDEINFSRNSSSLYIGEDWYIEVDNENNILNEYYINTGDPRVLEEMAEVKSELLNIKKVML